MFLYFCCILEICRFSFQNIEEEEKKKSKKADLKFDIKLFHTYRIYNYLQIREDYYAIIPTLTTFKL